MFTIDVGSVAVGLVGFVLAVFAWQTSANAVRSSYRPLLRPVRTLSRDLLLVKNYGKGPAIGVVVYQPPVDDNSQPIGEADIVEPLGQPLGAVPSEATRIGRLPIPVKNGTPLRDRIEHRILYQDLGGAWHETALVIIDNQFEATYWGPERRWRRRWFRPWGRVVPASALNRARVVRDPEAT